ncbi:MAG: mycothiol system anti-sigma-R factor [Actinobacteria bacterium]|jgi:mycothiol system anti-sigma-R factor|nr:mycothiol system anti-sigma-R factor [Actinomycetota bacterium]MCL6104307.1 mycothiol system anti-sigma-R factor [Actinomycetota bacterium]
MKPKKADNKVSADCYEALEKIYYFLDGRLTQSKRRAIQAHLQQCKYCLKAFDFETELKAVIADRLRESIPKQLRDKIASAILNEHNKPR